MAHFSRDTLGRDTKVLRPSFLKKQMVVLRTHVCLQPLAEEPRAMPGQEEDASPHSCSLLGARYLKLNPWSKKIYRKRISINHFKPPANLNQSKRCESYSKY